MKKTNRRNFIKTTMLSCGAVLAGCATSKKVGEEKPLPFLKYGATRQFKMKFAPRLYGLFYATAGKDLFKRLEFFRDAGFTAVEAVYNVNHNGKDYTEREIQHQILLGKKVKELGLEMSNVSSMNEKDFAMMTEFQLPIKDKKVFSKEGTKEELTKRMDKTFGVLKRIGSKMFIIGAGTRGNTLSYAKQFDNTLEMMAYCAEYCQENGFTMEIEPLNTTLHPGCFIDNATMGAKIVKAVDNPHCRLLYDFYHEQMQTGSLKSLDDDNVWKSIESFHIADSPSRREPGSGVINYKEVLKKVWNKGFRGFLALEHGQSKNVSDMQLLQIYRDLDNTI